MASTALKGRALHYVFKVADRTLTAKFYKDVLGMKVLRHEEFTEGCEAACNGPYDNRWSKTMVGYGFEQSNFAIELTYNYNVDSYEKGNDFIGITIQSREAIARAKATKWPILQEKETKLYSLEAPGGYRYYLIDEPQPQDHDPIKKVTLATSNLERTINYWHCELGMNIYEKNPNSIVMAYATDQTKIQFIQTMDKIDRATAYGRIAFAIPVLQLAPLETRMNEKNLKILTPMISLETPGKATVTVVILADPDGHEICFVDEESFMELSIFEEDADRLLERYIRKDEERKVNISNKKILP